MALKEIPFIQFDLAEYVIGKWGWKCVLWGFPFKGWFVISRRNVFLWHPWLKQRRGRVSTYLQRREKHSGFPPQWVIAGLEHRYVQRLFSFISVLSQSVPPQEGLLYYSWSFPLSGHLRVLDSSHSLSHTCIIRIGLWLGEFYLEKSSFLEGKSALQWVDISSWALNCVSMAMTAQEFVN